jgi:hypothetical protein
MSKSTGGPVFTVKTASSSFASIWSVSVAVAGDDGLSHSVSPEVSLSARRHCQLVLRVFLRAASLKTAAPEPSCEPWCLERLLQGLWLMSDPVRETARCCIAHWIIHVPLSVLVSSRLLPLLHVKISA